MEAVMLYGIANCDTMRKARRWLERRGIDYRLHDYRRHGLAPELLAEFNAALGWHALLNRRGTTWRSLPPADRDALDETAALTLMRTHPALIRRPVLALAGTYRVGFDESEYEEIFRRHA